MTIAPFCITFTHALITTPTTTFSLDLAFPLFLMNGTLQPIIYILAFSKLRKALLQLLFCCSTQKVTLDTVVVDAPLKLTMATMEMKSSLTKMIGRMPESPLSRTIV